MSDIKKMTPNEIDTELREIADSLADGFKKQRAIEAAGSSDQKGLAEHAKMADKISLLQGRKIALETARPAAEFAEKQRAIDRALETFEAARHAYSQAHDETRLKLEPILGKRIDNELINNALKVQPLFSKLVKTRGDYNSLRAITARWALEHGFKP